MGSQRLLGAPELPIKIVLKGLQGPITAGGKSYDSVMPGHEQLLSDQEIADVLSYARSAWGNDAGDIKAETVRKLREQWKEQVKPWTQKNLR